MMLQNLHASIAQYLQENTRLQQVLCYPSGRSIVEAPVGFLELSHIEMGSAVGTEELALVLTWNLRILVDASLQNAHIILQSLLIEAARSLYLQTFGLTPILALNFHLESFQDAEAFIIGSVSWSQECHVGDSVWEAGEWIPPSKVHVDWKGENHVR